MAYLVIWQMKKTMKRENFGLMSNSSIEKAESKCHSSAKYICMCMQSARRSLLP